VTASFADNEIWHVLIASDDMKRMNVEQLDDAFRLSLVDASTMVWKAGMNTWQSLGAVAGIDDEPETKVRWIEPPPPPRPMARPVPRPPSPPTRSHAPAPARFQTAVTPVYAAPLVAPVYTPQLRAPDPYVLPKRRVQIDSEVDFRRASGVHWGRWLLAFLLITGGVLGAYRQNLLREGARRIGIEGRYLYGEKRVTAFVTANAPAPLQNVLKRLALLPGPNAVPPPAPVTPTRAPAMAAPVVAAAKPAAEPSKPTEPEVKTVSLDSLPVLTTEPEATKPTPVAAAIAPAPRAKAVVAKAEPVAKRAAAPKAEKVEKPEPVAKAEPKPKPKAEPPPPANENPLKAAIRLAIAADAAKAKAKNK
jgi:hypothetical protein